MEQTHAIYTKIDAVCADAMYLSKANCDAIASTGAKPLYTSKNKCNIKGL